MYDETDNDLGCHPDMVLALLMPRVHTPAARVLLHMAIVLYDLHAWNAHGYSSSPAEAAVSPAEAVAALPTVAGLEAMLAEL